MGLGTSSETQIALTLNITNLLLTNPIMCIWITLGRWEDVRYIENKIVCMFVKMFQTYYILVTCLEQRNIETGYEADQFPRGSCLGGRCHLCFAIHYLCSCLLFNMTYSINQEVATSQWLFQLNSIYNRGFYASMGTKRRKFLTEIDFV